jgi:hypothetical protein
MFRVVLALLVAVVAAVPSSSSSSSSSLSVGEAYEHIRNSLPKSASQGGLCDANVCCNVTSTESCSISGMKRDASTLVLPGGETRCIFTTSTPFAFQVIPGDADKVLFYFQGGGACWDKGSTLVTPMCTTDCVPQKPDGLFDRSDVRNAYRSYTIIHVMYCSGDIFVGDITRDYTDSAGQPVVQKGVTNGLSAVNWAVGQQNSGNLAATLSNIAVMGCSAGSIGAQVFGNQILRSLKWKQAAVVPDSYAGVFPPGTQGPLIYSYGTCSTEMYNWMTPANQAKCKAQTLTLQDMDDAMMSEFPSVPYAFIESKTDVVQQSFYVAVGASSNASAVITPAQFYNNVNEIFGTYNKNHPNFLTYLVDGDQHCFTPIALYYTADPKVISLGIVCLGNFR